MGLKFKKIRYKNKFYAVVNVKYKTFNVPVTLDWDDFRVISSLGKTWKCNKFGFVSCSHKYKGVQKEVFIHEIVMALKQKGLKKKPLKKSILHINRIGWDNRRNNLEYDTKNKEKNKNIKKKRRTIELPENSGIRVEDIPTYVWYMKPDKTHGERFLVDVAGHYQWKTTSSKKLSLRYKLEEAKKYLREVKKSRPDLFEDYSMNGDFTKEGKELIISFFSIVYRAGYEHINQFKPVNNTDELLKPGKNRKDRAILKDQKFDPTQKGGNRRVINKLPENFQIKSSDLPKHTYYRPEKGYRGSYFVVENHPNQTGGRKYWQTTSSKKIGLEEKYEELIEYLEELE